MTVTQLTFAIFFGLSLHTITFFVFNAAVRIYFYFKDKPLREQQIKEMETFNRLMAGQYAQDVVDRGETIN